MTFKVRETLTGARLLCTGRILSFGGGELGGCRVGCWWRPGGGCRRRLGGLRRRGRSRFRLGCRGAVVVEVAFVGVSAMEDGAFYLDAEEVALVVYGEVVGGVVSAGLGQDQAVLGGAELETEFGPFSAEFGVGDVLALGTIGHGGP